MTEKTTLQRVYALADSDSCPDLWAAAGSILRKLASESPAVDKAAFVTKVFAKVPPGDQEDILKVCEMLQVHPRRDALDKEWEANDE